MLNDNTTAINWLSIFLLLLDWTKINSKKN